MYFSAKFDGDASLHNWYFPTTPVSNDHWQYEDTPVVWITTADPQYPWTEKTDSGSSESDDMKRRRSGEFIVNQYISMENYRRARPETRIPIIINGDITAFGHGDERDTMHKIFEQRFIKGDYFFGLGNHDYENNVNDCANNGCAKDSVLDLVGLLKSGKVFTYDLDTSSRSQTFKGSMAYVVELGPVFLIQLNNSPTYERSFSSGRPLLDVKRHFDIKPSVAFLSNILRLAKAMGRVAIVNTHRPDADDSYNRPDGALPALMNAYKVPAVYAGHIHQAFGVTQHAARWGNAVVFSSSAPFYKKYLISEYYPRQKILRVYAVTDNDPEAKQMIREIPVTFGQ